MRLTLTHDDGAVLGAWTVPDMLAPAQVEWAIADGLHRHHQLDRCGGFFGRANMVEVPDPAGPCVTCQPCADLLY